MMISILQYTYIHFSDDDDDHDGDDLFWYTGTLICVYIYKYIYIYIYVYVSIHTIHVPKIPLAPDLGEDARLDPTGGFDPDWTWLVDSESDQWVIKDIIVDMCSYLMICSMDTCWYF